ncbi:uncharacterized protein EDB91DRAFT_1234152 [Suillus paluster]|uniref:uncharacterized protein n=1 Tax=Suillus paluster TaxID=48578 RepID=UPI001B86C1F6|nr:uncharacterized protein EDB91DRAFT_1234152 [Suillus paluster]KAG1753749.1 hypothetical protein EDB91DRAFT_1234152 [Suillus paluster]
MLSPQPYRGLSRKLILAFDVGTTCSGISYCILDPGKVPRIEPVTRWKLHMRARHPATSNITDNDIPPLPRGKNIVEVLADFMQYLFRCARSYIEETEARGPNLWQSVETRIEFVLTHPNGWEGPQQKQIRLAAILGGLVPRTEEGMARVHLLTEGEASLAYCTTNILASGDGEEEDSSTSQGVVVIDAGRATLDLSAYSVTLSPTLIIKEIAPAECRLQGSIFVTRRAHGLLQEKLSGSRFGTPDMVQRMTDIFDSTTKLRFRNPEESSYIKFGTIRDRDPQRDIRSGQLKLNGQDVATLFEPSISNIIEAFENQRKAAGTPITFVFFIGGFAASDWMFEKLQRYFQSLGISFSRPNSHCNRAVADGAVLYFIDHLVSSCLARYTYGTKCSVPFNPSDMEHRIRRKQVFRSDSGNLALPHGFSSILTKGTRVSEQQEFSETFTIRQSNQAACNNFEVDIIRYTGLLSQPKWMDTEQSLFSTLCTIRADTSEIAQKLTPKRSTEGSTYYAMEIKVILLFGLLELKAVIGWEDGGEKIRQVHILTYLFHGSDCIYSIPAAVIYDDEQEEVYSFFRATSL